MNHRAGIALACICLLAFCMLFAGCAAKPPEQPPKPAADQTIIDEWKSVPVPPPPELKAVTPDVKTTALLILDMQTALTNNPRGTASIAKVQLLLQAARAKGMLVVYSLTPTGAPADIVPQLTPVQGDPMVQSTVDKFYKTDLERILLDRGIKTVIVTGTAAHGAVLYTATGAAVRGFQVIVPVEGMSATDPYAEQYTAWHMLNSPGTRNRATLTKVSMISF
jgi:nicotinamidase-related amidase